MITVMDHQIGFFYSTTISILIFTACCISDDQQRTPQPNVLTGNKLHALYLWIFLPPRSSLRAVVDLTTSLQSLAQEVARDSLHCSVNSTAAVDMGDLCSEVDTDIVVGVGFGYKLYKQIVNDSHVAQFILKTKTGPLGELPGTGGDLFVHAKSDDRGALFEFARVIIDRLKKRITNFSYEDIYGFVYKDSRDLSGFIDGTENLKHMDKRSNVVLDSDNGTYGITQKWVHNMDFIAQQRVYVMEGFIGRRMNDSIELNPKPASAHIARMTSGPQFNATKPVRMFRQSMPYGRLVNSDQCGLFFIGFANDVNNFEYFLNRMTPAATADDDRKIATTREIVAGDDVMRFSTCKSGNYWYFPSLERLEKIRLLDSKIAGDGGRDRHFLCDDFPSGDCTNGGVFSSRTTAFAAIFCMISATFWSLFVE